MDNPNESSDGKALPCDISNQSNSIYTEANKNDNKIRRLTTSNDNTHANTTTLITRENGKQHESVDATLHHATTTNNASQHNSDMTMATNETINTTAATSQMNRKAELAKMLHNFIGNLAEQLPAISKAPPIRNTSDVNPSDQRLSNGKMMRPTTDLLEELQRALTTAPSPAARNLFVQSPAIADTKSTLSSQQPKHNHVIIRIERARYYPKLRTHDKQMQSNTVNNEVQLSPFCTFEAISLPSNKDGPSIKMFSSKPIFKCHVPEWHEQFNVSLDDDLLIVHSWHRNANQSEPDTYLGRSTIDLRAIAHDHWYKVEDEQNLICGHVKIIIEHEEKSNNVRDQSAQPMSCNEPEDTMMDTTITATTNAQVRSLHQFIESDDFSMVLKDKFEQLEVISERLRSRLFDVTGVSDDDFENDLNTIPPEDDDFEQTNRDNAMGLNWLEYCQGRSAGDSDNHIDTIHSSKSSNHHQANN